MVASIKKCGYFEQSQEDDEEEEEEEEEDEGEEEEAAAEGENDEDQEVSGDDAAQPTQVSILHVILWCRVTVPLKRKLPPSRETRILYRETRVSSLETRVSSRERVEKL